MAAVEIESGQTLIDQFFADLSWLADQDLGPSAPRLDPMLVYAGRERQQRTGATVVPWFAAHEVAWWDSMGSG